MNYIYLDSNGKIVAQNIVGLYPGATDNSLDLYLFADFDLGPSATNYQVTLVFQRQDSLKIGEVNALYQASNAEADDPIVNPITGNTVNVHKFSFAGTKILDIVGQLGITVRYTSSSGTKVAYTTAKVNKADDVEEYETVATSLANIAQNRQAIENILSGDSVVGEAVKSSKDGNGNNIVNTYATKDEAADASTLSISYDTANRSLTIGINSVNGDDTENSITLPLVSASNPGLLSASRYSSLLALLETVREDLANNLEVTINFSTGNVVIGYSLWSVDETLLSNRSITIPTVDASNAGLMSTTLLSYLNAVRSKVGLSGSAMMDIAAKTWMTTIDSVIQALNAVTNYLDQHAIDDATTSINGANNSDNGYDIRIIKKNFAGTNNDLLVTIPKATTSLNGVMSSEDKRRLDVLYGLLGETNDADTLVNTINEVLAIFNNYPEGTTLINALAQKSNVADIVDNLNSQISDKPLSANQGYVLNSLITNLTNDKVSFSDIIDNLTTADSTKALSANMGKWLKDNMITWDDLLAYALEDAEYDEDTGEVTLTYVDTGNLAMSYDDTTGVITFTYGNE